MQLGLREGLLASLARLWVGLSGALGPLVTERGVDHAHLVWVWMVLQSRLVWTDQLVQLHLVLGLHRHPFS